MLGIIPIQRFGVAENSRGLFKRHAVLLQVAQSLSGIPGEHISVYTLIRARWEATSHRELSIALQSQKDAGPSPALYEEKGDRPTRGMERAGREGHRHLRLGEGAGAD